MIPPSTLQALVRHCVEMLVRGDLPELRLAAMNSRMSAEEIRAVLEDYPGQLTLPGETAYTRMHIYDVQPNGWQNVEFELWYDDQESDLTLSLQVRDTPSGGELRIHDIHVL